jgi:hypothetical protein
MRTETTFELGGITWSGVWFKVIPEPDVEVLEELT